MPHKTRSTRQKRVHHHNSTWLQQLVMFLQKKGSNDTDTECSHVKMAHIWAQCNASLSLTGTLTFTALCAFARRAKKRRALDLPSSREKK